MAPSSIAPATITPHGYFADVYTFDWTKLSFRVPLICSIAIALCLTGGVSSAILSRIAARFAPSPAA